LFFDTETTGLPRSWKAPVTRLDNWPRLVQLAWLTYDAAGNCLSEQNRIIRPEGFSIPADAASVHGISTERAMEEGLPLQEVLVEFSAQAQDAELLVAHNRSFDEKIVGAELLRHDFQNIIDVKRRICTMKSTTDFCRIHGPYGYKWPKLSELHYELFREYFEEAHNAAVDINATAKCFWELRRLGVL